jgi:WD40 repeat protein/biotin carboxyl carrier protein
MLRWYPVTVAGAVVVIGLVVAFCVYGPSLTATLPDNSQSVSAPPVPLPPAQLLPPAPPVQARERHPAPGDGPDNAGSAAVVNARGALVRALVIPSHVAVIQKTDVPSLREGQLLYVATEIKPEEKDTLKRDQIVELPESYLYVEMKPDETTPQDEIQDATVTRDGKSVTTRWRRLRDNDTIVDWSKVDRLLPRTRKLRLLKEGDEVKKGQLLGLIDPLLVLDEFDIKKTKLWAAKADEQSSIKAREEAQQRYETLVKLYRGATPGSAAYEEVRQAKFQADHYYYEAISKGEAIKQAERELSQTLTTVRMHEIRAKIDGVVKILYKQQGDAVKNQDPVLHLDHHDRLRIEGRVEWQYLAYLPKDKTVVIEPSQPRSPRAVLSGHLQEVRGVAVSKDRKIISAGDDRKVIVWDHVSGDQKAVLPHPAAVLAVACSPKDYQRNLCLSGAADGYGRLWDLDSSLTEPALKLQFKHQGPVNCVAFSPSGKWCVTGGEDKTIYLWNTATGERLQELKKDGHVGPVTSLQFLSEQQLVSAGKDKYLILWTLDANGAPEKVDKPAIRSNDVPVLGVNPAEKQVLVDKGKELQILQMPEGRLAGSLQNASDAMNFSTMALFSPTGKLILTAGQSDSRLQIWRAPTSDSRAYELRQLIWPGQPATCAAFSPDSDKPEDLFVVTGTGDRQVVVWDLPDKKEVQERLTATVTLVEPSLETASRDVRVWAELDNKDRRLKPGQSATMVAYPGK